MEAGQLHRRVLLQGIDVSASVRRIEVEDHDRKLDEAKVLLDDANRVGAEAPREGQTLLVEVGWGEEHAIIFEGEVTEVEVVEHPCDPRQIRIRAFDLGWRIRRRPIVPRNHVGTLSAILTEILNQSPATGITVGEIAPDPDPEYTEEQPLRQTTENDWDFIQEQARRQRCRAFVEFNDNQSKFYFLPIARLNAADPMGRLNVEGMAGRILSFDYSRRRGQAPQRRSATVTDEAGAVVEQPSPVATPEAERSPSDATLRRDAASGGRLERAAPVLAEATSSPEDNRRAGPAQGLPSDPQRAREAASEDPTSRLGQRARGRCVGTIMLRAKGQVEVAGVTAWATGNWYVRKVKHVAQSTRSDGRNPAYACHFELTR